MNDKMILIEKLDFNVLIHNGSVNQISSFPYICQQQKQIPYC